jgi:hypothetical protein
VAAESSGYAPGAPAPRTRLRVRAPDAVLVAFTLTPALTLLGS